MPLQRWILRSAEPELLHALDRCTYCSSKSPLVRRLLAQRGVTPGEPARRFLNPQLRELTDPFLLPDMDRAVERLLLAADRQENVVLYGDYDVDGVTSLALLHAVLVAYGLRPRCFLPSRMGEGYGVTRDGLTRCLATGRPSLLVAVDCGTTSRTEASWLQNQGIDVIVLDHHEVDPERLPACVAVVNPKRGTGWHYLCSAGVVFKLAHALGRRRRVPDFDLREHLDIVALATVADIVPLVEENRLLVRKGLQMMAATRKAGLRALASVAGLTGPFTSMDLGFRLGPRLNAAGRLDTAQASLDLLLCEDDETAAEFARQLDLQNRERQSLEGRIQSEADAQAAELMDCDDPPCGLVVAGLGWHPGVVGIVAARLMRRYHRPVFVIAVDETGIGKGSGRSVPGISLVQVIDSCRSLLLSGGGHGMAAGVTLPEENIPAFREHVADHVARQACDGQLEPKLYLDAETRLEELTLPFLDDYDQLQPFGNCNPQPLFVARGVHVLEEPRLLKDRHWRLELIQSGTIRSAIWFNAASESLPPPPWDVAFHIGRNTWRGQTTLQLMVQAVRSAGPIENGGPCS